jgi:hypothetical protein
MRLHLFEIEDFSWYPSFLRELQTDYLRKLMDVFKVYKSVLPGFVKFIGDTGESKIIDYCSGGGGSWNQIIPLLGDSGIITITLTDLYPNLSAFRQVKSDFPGIIQFKEHPVNAVNPPDDLRGLRTFFNSFHHFSPEDG